MGGRHEARQWAVQFLFQRDFNQDDLEPALELFWAGVKGAPSARRFAEELIRGVDTRRAELDQLIQKYAENWDLKRMGAVDRNVMRVGLYEMLHCPDVPPVVSINEAVELAKELSGSESGKFVNGILDRARKDIDRPARAAHPAAGKKEKLARGHVD
ncbi:MAG TPA: transcription antitermination factor NusB [Kiritimatiellia bacterium]|nr:transcription antitermination factor NusB [Kiritimatiellia bacterium]HRZ12911.1 transcription antitermination factor NusB [Kiritimatiellia bacterium]HSA18479.1 transcription antitermination factor NusB [Kiritimatiellia bacterium]